MKVSAGLLFRRAAGMKNRRVFDGRQAGEFQFLECARRHGRDLSPMLHCGRRCVSRRADLLIRSVVSELQREKFESEFGELPIADCRLPIVESHAAAGTSIALLLGLHV
jgi:hypothetical protein